jgi:hypothetical protein
VDDKGRDAIQAIAQQQGALWQLRQQALRHRPFGFALPPDRGGQRIVQTEFEQDRRGDLGEGGSAPARPRFRERGRDLGRVDQTELRPVERHQPPPAPKRLAVLARRRARPQRAPHQLREDLPRQAQTPIGPRTVGQRLAEQLEQVIGQCARVLHHVKGQRRQQLRHRHPRFAATPQRHRWNATRAQEALPRGEKPRRRIRRASVLSLGMRRHPQRKYRCLAQCTRGFSHQRISERH